MNVAEFKVRKSVFETWHHASRYEALCQTFNWFVYLSQIINTRQILGPMNKFLIIVLLMLQFDDKNLSVKGLNFQKKSRKIFQKSIGIFVKQHFDLC